MKKITVRAAEGSERVALYERHEAHPNGEVFVAGANEVEVALTPAVSGKLRIGELLQVDTAVADDVNATDSAIALAEEHSIDLNDVTGTGKDGRVTAADVKKVIADGDADSS